MFRPIFKDKGGKLLRIFLTSSVFFALLVVSPALYAAAKGYVLKFDNFAPEQVNQVMVYATRFEGYEQFELLEQRGRDSKIDYQSDISRVLLSYNFEQSFQALKWEVVSQQEGDQYLFSFIREKPIPLPYGVW